MPVFNLRREGNCPGRESVRGGNVHGKCKNCKKSLLLVKIVTPIEHSASQSLRRYHSASAQAQLAFPFAGLAFEGVKAEALKMKTSRCFDAFKR